jgi:hypothetical protein
MRRPSTSLRCLPDFGLDRAHPVGTSLIIEILLHLFQMGVGALSRRYSDCAGLNTGDRVECVTALRLHTLLLTGETPTAELAAARAHALPGHGLATIVPSIKPCLAQSLSAGGSSCKGDFTPSFDRAPVLLLWLLRRRSAGHVQRSSA